MQPWNDASGAAARRYSKRGSWCAKRSLKNPPFTIGNVQPPPKKTKECNIYYTQKWWALEFCDSGWKRYVGFFNSFNFSIRTPPRKPKMTMEIQPFEDDISYKKRWSLSSQPCRGFPVVGAQKFTAAACWVGNARPPSAILKAWHVRQLEHRRPGAWPTKNDPQKMGESMVVNAELYVTPVKWQL